MPNTDWTIYEEVDREAWRDREPRERPDYEPDDCGEPDTDNPPPVTAEDFAPRGFEPQPDDDIPF